MRLNFKFEVKEISDTGELKGYASTFGNEDHGGDIIVAGAFKKTIKENPEVAILWRHDGLIGVNHSAQEDKHGLHVQGALNLEVQQGREAHSLAKQRAVKGLSIGYEPVIIDWSRKNEGIRILKEVKLYEYSLTPFPMNEQALIQSVKTADDVEVECIRLERFLTKSNLSPSQRETLQRQFIKLLSLLATSPAAKEEAGTPADEHADEAPEVIHAALSDFRRDLDKLTLR